ncbi:hypothetical protein Mgra_00006866 [Meloidogyne graminicola]|uniref:Cytochrome P450 n=1 Tax=Meloidogyne graminicola TaxID=189291 RepID=A0A8S9ZJS0_9BILA|nr:hypothetical protein Mgra_00006866 [Meloidogyne graminicola]
MLILILLILLISALFLFLTTLKRNNYWKNRGIPGPEPLPFKGNIDLIFGKNPFALQLQRWSKIYGNIYGIKNGWINQLIISEPVMVKELLVDKFDNFHGRAISPLFGDVETKKLIHLFFAKGKRWKRLRAIANPAFSISNLKRVMPIMNDSIKINIQLLKEAQINEKYIDLNNVVNRVCEETTTLGNITIEKGTAISVDLFTLHRNKNIWGEDSEQFKPERWLNEEGNKIKNLAFYPFGGGPRICIGMRLGIMEAKMILVQLLRTFELKRCSETKIELDLSGQIVLNSGRITVELILRK